MHGKIHENGKIQITYNLFGLFSQICQKQNMDQAKRRVIFFVREPCDQSAYRQNDR